MSNEKGWLSIEDICAVCGLTEEEAKYHLKILKAGKMIKEKKFKTPFQPKNKECAVCFALEWGYFKLDPKKKYHACKQHTKDIQMSVKRRDKEKPNDLSK